MDFYSFISDFLILMFFMSLTVNSNAYKVIYFENYFVERNRAKSPHLLFLKIQNRFTATGFQCVFSFYALKVTYKWTIYFQSCGVNRLIEYLNVIVEKQFVCF